MKQKMTSMGYIMSLAFALVALQPAKAQQPNVSLRDQMDFVMAPLDFTEVSSGLFLDRGFKMMNVADFDGTANTDTLFDYGNWFRQYGSLVTSKVTSAATRRQQTAN